MGIVLKSHNPQKMQMHSYQVCLIKSICLLIGTTIPALLVHASTSPYTNLHHSECSGSWNLRGSRARGSQCAKAGKPVEDVQDMLIGPVLSTTSISHRMQICAQDSCQPNIVMAHLVLGTTTTHGQLKFKQKKLKIVIVGWMQ